MNIGLLLTSPVSLLLVLRTHRPAGSSGERQTLAGGFHTPEVAASSFQNFSSGSSICGNPEIFGAELCGQAESCSKHYSVQLELR